jgi:hypothetical protein
MEQLVAGLIPDDLLCPTHMVQRGGGDGALVDRKT